MSAPLLRRLFVVLLLAALLAAGVWWLGRPQAVAVVLREIDRGVVESSIANTRAGTVEACQRTRSVDHHGRPYRDPGGERGRQVCKKGQLLMKLWNDDQQAQSTLAMAQVETARKRVAEACTVAANAEREAERQTALFKQGFVSGFA
jgi:HlyD family secretion protein